MVRQADRRYLEDLVEIFSADLDILDGDRSSQVFSVAHLCQSTGDVNSTDTDELLLKNVRRRENSAGFANLGKKQQTTMPELII